MNRTINLNKDHILAGVTEVIVEIQQSDVAACALELTLLLHGLSGSLCFVSGTMRLTLQISELPRAPAAVISEVGGRVRCSLSRESAEYLQAVLLRAYRDGIAEVNHVHIEGKMDGKSVDVTFVFDTFRPPMTSEEAEKLMGR